MSALDDLLRGLPGFSLLTEGMKTAALEGARIPDSFGVWPGEEGYEPTYDVFFAALNLLGFLKAQQVVTSTSSEGTSVSVSKPEWDSLATYFRTMSPIIQASGGAVLTYVPVPDVPHVLRTNMNGRGGYYGDVNTDLG